MLIRVLFLRKAFLESGDQLIVLLLDTGLNGENSLALPELAVFGLLQFLLNFVLLLQHLGLPCLTVKCFDLLLGIAESLYLRRKVMNYSMSSRWISIAHWGSARFSNRYSVEELASASS